MDENVGRWLKIIMGIISVATPIIFIIVLLNIGKTDKKKK